MHPPSFVRLFVVMYQHHWVTFDQFDHPQRQCMHNFADPDPKMHQDSMNLLHHNHQLVPGLMFVAVHFLGHHPMLHLDPNYLIYLKKKKTKRNDREKKIKLVINFSKKNSNLSTKLY